MNLRLKNIEKKDKDVYGMPPTIDFILIVFFMFLVAAVLFFLTEIRIIETYFLDIIFMLLYVQKFNTLTILPASPLLTLLFSAIVFSLAGATVVGAIRAYYPSIVG